MKPTTAKITIRVLTWLTAILVIALIVTAIYYFLKPVGPDGHNCTFDNFGCESNANILIAFGCLWYAFMVGAAYGVIRLVIWLIARRHQSR
jgi:hypothetical protein